MPLDQCIAREIGNNILHGYYHTAVLRMVTHKKTGKMIWSTPDHFCQCGAMNMGCKVCFCFSVVHIANALQ